MTSVPARTDFEQAIAAERERWICKACAYTSNVQPAAKGPRASRCPECGGHAWHRTTAPIPVI